MDKEILRIQRNLIKSFLEEDRPLETMESNSTWSSIREQGSQLWLDTSNLARATDQWTRDFRGLTTNNSLLNSRIQTGEYDEMIKRASQSLQRIGLPNEKIVHEISFLLNVLHGKRLINRFDCQVSVELHTDFARDIQRTLDYARRFSEMEPERFIVKIPFTLEGIIATHQLAGEGIPVNQTLAFSVRQNYIIALLSDADFGNVFVGRLNHLFENHDLPKIKRLGEKVALSANKTLKFLRRKHRTNTLLIAASIRDGSQIMNLAGIDVLTIPPEVANEYLTLAEEKQTTGRLRVDDLLEQLNETPGHSVEKLLKVKGSLRDCVENLMEKTWQNLSSAELRSYFQSHGVDDLFPAWTADQIEQSRSQGKIPDLSKWADDLDDGSVALDSLLSLAGLNSFSRSQNEMDSRIRRLIR